MNANRFKQWTPLFLTHFLSVLNDNLLKGAITFLAIYWAPESWTAWILAASSFLLVLPFLALSALGGRLTVLTAKAKVVERAKQVEIPLMTFGAIAMWTQNLWLALATLFLMGIQSAIHGPAKMGLIAETAKGGERSWGTGIMEMLAFMGVLLGMLVAGWVAESDLARNVFAGLFIFIASCGALAARAIKYQWPAKGQKLPSAGPLKFFRSTWNSPNQPNGLKSILLGEGAFWLMGSMLQLILLLHLPAKYGATSGQTAGVVAIMAIGIGLGCWTTARLCAKRFEPGLVAIASWGMLFLFMVPAFFSLSLNGLTVVMFFISFLSGVFKVPLNVWVQQRVPEAQLGKVLALANMISFGFVLLGAALFAGLATFLNSGQILTFMIAVTGVTALAVTWIMFDRFVYSIGWMLSKLLFKITFKGTDNIPRKGGALVVANHGSYLDFLLLVAALPRRVRFVMLKDVYDKPFLNPLLKKLHMIPINPRKGGNNLRDFNDRVRAEVNAGHVVCIFAEGTVTRTGQMLQFQKGVEHLSKDLNAPVIPIHYDNVPGTPMTYTARLQKRSNWSPANWRRKLTCTVGSPEPQPVFASNLRMRMKEMEAEAFTHRPKPKGSINEEIYQALKSGDQTLSDPQGSLSMPELLREARTLAVELEALPGSCIALAYENDLNMQVAMVAGIMARKTVLPMDVKTSSGEAMLIAKLGGCEQLLTTQSQTEQWGKLGDVDYIVYDRNAGKKRSWTVRFSKRVHGSMWGWRPLPFPADKPIFRIPDKSQGHLNLLDIQAENLWAVQAGLAQVAHTKNLKTIFMDLPAHQSWGLALPILSCAYLKLNVILNGQANPVEVMANKKPDAAILDARHLEDLLASGPMDLSFLKQLHTGSELIAPEVVKQLEERGTRLYQSVGMNRTGSILTLNMPDFDGLDMVGTPMFQKNAESGSIGKPLPGIAIRIVDMEDVTLVLNPGQIGRVLVKGAAVVHDQFNAWSEQLADHMDNWVLTPLVGALDEHGFLRLSHP